MRAELFMLAAALAAPASAAKRPARPAPEALLAAAAAEPSAPYEARVRVQFFPADGKPKGQTRLELRAPGGRRRVEVLGVGKNAPAKLIRLSDGKRETVLWPKERRAWTGAAASAAPEPGGFELLVSTGGRVAKRPTWKLEFRAKSGALRRAQWTDRETGLLLKREDYGPEGRLERRTRIVRLSLGAAAPPERFDASPPAGWTVDSSSGALARALSLLDSPPPPGRRGRGKRGAEKAR